MFALTTYRRPANTLANWFGDLFDDDFFRLPAPRETTSWTPRVDVVEDEHAYHLHAELPGLDKKDIDVSVENGVLTLSGERKFEKKEEKDDGYRYYERSYGSFCRSFRLPEHVDPNAIKATHKNGVLELTLPKSEKAKPKQIEVKVQ